MPMVEEYVTLACVSNEVGGPLVGNARWLGRAAGRRAGPRPACSAGADQLVGRSIDGFTAGMPDRRRARRPHRPRRRRHERRAAARRHGFPARLVVAGPLRLRVGHQVADRARAHDASTPTTPYWVRAGLGPAGPVLVESRIDVPARRPPRRRRAAAWPAWRGRRVAGISRGRGAGRRRRRGPTPPSPTRSARRRGGSGSTRGTPRRGRHGCGCGPPTAPGRCRPRDQRDPFPNAATGYHQIVAIVD